MGFFERNTDLFELISHKSSDSGGGFGSNQSTYFELEGKTVVIVDEWPTGVETAEANPEITVRKDTLGVVAVVALAAIVLAFLAGRSTARETPPAKRHASIETQTQGPLPQDVFDPAKVAQQPAQPQTQNPGPQPAPTTNQPAANTGFQRNARGGKHILLVVTTTREKAGRVAEFLNKDAQSPIANRPDLEAYLKGRQVRIRGFREEEANTRAKVRNMKDPTGGGHFKQAFFVKGSGF